MFHCTKKRFSLVTFTLLSVASLVWGQENTQAKKIGVIQDRSILECSGISPSLNFDDHYWVHNDSGGKGTAFLITAQGKTRLKVQLKDVKNRDFEDCVTFRQKGKSFVAIGDIGDNLTRRRELLVYIFAEPDSLPKQTNISTKLATVITFSFEDKISRDCEGIAYFAPAKQLLVCSKLKTGEILKGKKAELFQVEFDIGKKKQRSTAKKIADVPGGMNTAMDISPDGRLAVIRNYLDGNIFKISDSELGKSFGKDPGQKVTLPFQRQSEAICFSKDGKKLIVTSEGKNPDIFAIPLR